MSDHTRKDRLIREALGASDAPVPTPELTPTVVYAGLVLLVVAVISGGLRIDAGIPDAHAVVAATAQLAPAPDAAEGNVQDLTY
jgi:hypothetical protein